MARRQKIPGKGRIRNASGKRFKDEDCCCTVSNTCSDIIDEFGIENMRVDVDFGDPGWWNWDPVGPNCTSCAEAPGPVIFDFPPTQQPNGIQYDWEVEVGCLLFRATLYCNRPPALEGPLCACSILNRREAATDWTTQPLGTVRWHRWPFADQSLPLDIPITVIPSGEYINANCDSGFQFGTDNNSAMTFSHV